MMTYDPLWDDDQVINKGPEGVTAKLAGTYPYEIRPGAFEARAEDVRHFRTALTNRVLALASTDKVCLFTRHNVAETLRTPIPSFKRRFEVLIAELARYAQRSLFKHVHLSLKTNDRLTNDLCRATSTSDAQELRGMVLHARKLGLVQTGETVTNDSYKLNLTPEGLIQAEDSEATPISSRNAFVAMWFDSSIDEAYADGIAPAVRALGYEPVRIDQKEHANKIDDEIIFEIRKARFLVADFTSGADGPRGGVYFEAGYALALGRPVIWTVRNDQIGKVHFDTRQFNHITWSAPSDLRQSLEKRIGALIGPYGSKI